MEFAVETEGLTKIYGGRSVVDHIDLRVRRGEIYGFIGRNGAGKSTTLKMICGLAHPSEGRVTLFGAGLEDETVRRRVGMLIENPGLFPNLSARENMMLKARCLGLADESSVKDVLALLGLSEAGKKKVGKFSMGMKQRLGIAMALLGNPDLLILDEPVNGLDPEGMREIRQTLIRLADEEGKTIVISSHMLGELSKIATCYGIIKDGRLLEQISRKELNEKCRDYLMLEVDDAERACVVLMEHLPDLPVEVYDSERLHIYGTQEASPLTALLVQNQVAVNACVRHTVDLESYFLRQMEGDN